MSTRICYSCKKETPVEECVRNRNHCLTCHKARCHSWYVRNAAKHNTQAAQQRDSPEWREERATYLRSRRPQQREAAKRHSRRYNERYPEKTAAKRAVRDAIQQGVLVRPSNCGACGQPDPKRQDGATAIHAHHHEGYDRPLSVQWLCVKCHSAAHSRALISQHSPEVEIK